MKTDMKDALRRVIQEYPSARREEYAGHPLANFIRETLSDKIETMLGEFSQTFLCKSSAGAGNWSNVPWASIFDPLVTDSATRGYYIVYLFSANQPEVFLSLNQGATAVMDEFKTRARDVLRDRAALIRARLSDSASRFEVHNIQLGSTLSLTRGYEAGHAFGKLYRLDALPTEDVLRNDLQQMARAYLTLTFRGGLEPTPDLWAGAQTSTNDDDMPRPGASLVEVLQYRFHRKIDRHPKAAQEAKAYHGSTCQACGFSFSDKYGEIGEGFIEAHHRRPLSTLEEGVPVPYDVATDFAVLCSNCHRMIHRSSDPSDITAFRESINLMCS